jgi:hypothetical protein
LCFNPFF